MLLPQNYFILHVARYLDGSLASHPDVKEV